MLDITLEEFSKRLDQCYRDGFGKAMSVVKEYVSSMPEQQIRSITPGGWKYMELLILNVIAYCETIELEFSYTQEVR